MATASSPFIFLIISFIFIFFVSVHCSSHDKQIQQLQRQLNLQSVKSLDVQSIRNIMESSEKTLSVDSRIFLVDFVSNHSNAINRVDNQMTRVSMYHKTALQQVLQAAEELNKIANNVQNYGFHLNKAINSLEAAEHNLNLSEKHVDEALDIIGTVQADVQEKIQKFQRAALKRQKQFRLYRFLKDWLSENGRGKILILVVIFK